MRAWKGENCQWLFSCRCFHLCHVQSVQTWRKQYKISPDSGANLLFLHLLSLQCWCGAIISWKTKLREVLRFFCWAHKPYRSVFNYLAVGTFQLPQLSRTSQRLRRPNILNFTTLSHIKMLTKSHENSWLWQPRRANELRRSENVYRIPCLIDGRVE